MTVISVIRVHHENALFSVSLKLGIESRDAMKACSGLRQDQNWDAKQGHG